MAILQIAHLESVFGAQLIRASVQGSILIALVWVVCRILPRLPAAGRQWLWALACLKLIVCLVCVVPVAVALLPAVAMPTDLAGAPALAHVRFVAPQAGYAPTAVGPPPLTVADNSAFAVPVGLTDSRRPTFDLVRYAMGSLCLYFVVVALLLITALVRASVMRRIIAAAAVVEAPDLRASIAQCAESVGLSRLPRVRVSSFVAGPLVFGLISPTILLPGAIRDGFVVCAIRDDEEMRLALTHEMAHIARRDMWLSVIPFGARLLFWFHPLALLAEAEYRTAMEQACDSRTLAATGARPGDYFRLLVRVAESSGAGGALAMSGIGLSAGFRMLQRRLGNLAHGGVERISQAMRLAACLLIATSVVVMAPIRLTARVRGWIHANLPIYEITDLETPADRDTTASAINNDGAVVGELLPSRSRGPGQAIVWRDGIVTAIGSLTGYRHTMGNGINAAGVVVASAYNFGAYHHAFIWQGGASAIGSLPGYRYSKAFAIDDAGDVVGCAQAGRPHFGVAALRAFLWKKGRAIDLGALGGDSSCAYAIDNRGDVVGKADTSAPLIGGAATHAFLWSGGAMVDLGTLGGSNSVAYAVNDLGVVAGAADVTPYVRHGCLWYRGRICDMGALAVDANSQVRGLNRAGQAVGLSTLGGGATDTHAVLWQDGRIVDLNTLLPQGSTWTLEDARSINDCGEIAGFGILNGRKRAFVLTPAAGKSPGRRQGR